MGTAGADRPLEGIRETVEIGFAESTRRHLHIMPHQQYSTYQLSRVDVRVTAIEKGVAGCVDLPLARGTELQEAGGHSHGRAKILKEQESFDFERRIWTPPRRWPGAGPRNIRYAPGPDKLYRDNGNKIQGRMRRSAENHHKRLGVNG